MRPVLLFFLLSLIGGGATQALGQEDIVNTRLLKEVRTQWPSDEIGKMTRNVMMSMFNFHGALIRKNMRVLALTTSKKLHYQHSNGWVETQEEQFRNIETGYLIYHRIFEDSVKVTIRSDKNATVLFQATIDVTLQGKRNTYRLLVEEDWSRQAGSNHWFIYARRATKL